MQDRVDDVLDQVGLDRRLDVDALAVLGRDQHALDLDRRPVAVLVELVAHRDLRLAVGPQVVERAVLAHLGEAAGEPVREHDRERHQLGRLVDGVAEHHALVARADAIERIARAVLLRSNDASTPCAMSLDCSSSVTMIPHVSASKPYLPRV